MCVLDPSCAVKLLKLIQWGPFFFLLEGLSSLIVAQRLGQMGKRLIEQADSEVYQFTLLVAAAVTYVLSAYWCVIVGFSI